MAKEVVWSNKAKLDRLHILTYWTERNKSEVYASKLNKLFSQAIKTIAKFEMPRRQTEFDNVKVVIVKSYKIFFRETDDTVYILRIWDARQDPNKLDLA